MERLQQQFQLFVAARDNNHDQTNNDNTNDNSTKGGVKELEEGRPNYTNPDNAFEVGDSMINGGGDNNNTDVMLKEYGYKYEYNPTRSPTTTSEEDNNEDDDEEEDYDPLSKAMEQTQEANHPNETKRLQPLKQSTAVITKSDEHIPYIFCLGTTYHPVHDYHPRKQYESSLFWFTYRYDFPEIVPYRITSDAGWGCMLRSAQMLLAHTLRVHFQSSKWTPSKSLQKTRAGDKLTMSIMTWFADFPSKTESVYSLHNMVAAGLAKYETLPGEWYGPGTACYVIRDLVALHAKTQPSLFRVHVCEQQGTIYKDKVYELMAHDSKKRAEERRKQQQQQNPTTIPQPSHPLEDPLIQISSTDQTAASTTLQQPINVEDLEWDTGLLLLIPLRLGLDKFNEEYSKLLAQSFWLPQSVGVLGGRPRGARWFYGAYADGSRVLGLDPHTVQCAPTKTHGGKQIYMSDEYLRSVHTPYPEIYPIPKMDPSIAIGYYCRNKKEFAALEASLQEMKSIATESNKGKSIPDLFTFENKAPDYLNNDNTTGDTAGIDGGVVDSMLSDTMNDPFLDDGDDNTGGGGGGGQIEESDDEDEYVLL